MPQDIGAGRIARVSRHQESATDKHRDLYGIEFEKRIVLTQTFQQDENMVVEGLELRRMPQALGVLNRHRVQSEIGSEYLPFLLR